MRDPFGKLLLFGATGDLAQRMLLPSLYGLHADGLLSSGLTITGTARSTLSDAEYRDFAAKALATHLPDDRKDDGQIASFLDRLQYQPLDASKTDGFGELAAKLGDISNGLAIFLSTAPSLFEPTIEGLASAGLAGDNVRIGLEKPLGFDLASSREINDAVASVFPENRTFRIDHYLGKETVQNILVFRFANGIFEPLWNRNHVAEVQITVAETIGVEGRGSYYEEAGALRDMVQNHMLQLLCLIGMEPPVTFDAGPVRDEKNKVMQALRPIDPAKVDEFALRAQYTAGYVSGKPVPGYRQEKGVRPDSTTET
jgi:glucose-6-phosphate 1-dehydrogenase